MLSKKFKIKVSTFILYIVLLIILIVLHSQAKARLNVQINEDNCKIIQLRYTDTDTYMYAVGNCDILYEMCYQDYCEIKELEQKDLNFGNREDVGLLLYEGN